MATQNADSKTKAQNRQQDEKAQNKGRDDREARSKADAEAEEIEQVTQHEKRQAAEDPSR